MIRSRSVSPPCSSVVRKSFKSHTSVYRIHWLKAKARRDRWEEEEKLIPEEMGWTVNFFRGQAAWWSMLSGIVFEFPSCQHYFTNSIFQSARRNELVEKLPEDMDIETGSVDGKVCYAKHIASCWNEMAERAEEKFAKAKALRD